MKKTPTNNTQKQKTKNSKKNKTKNNKNKLGGGGTNSETIKKTLKNGL